MFVIDRIARKHQAPVLIHIGAGSGQVHNTVPHYVVKWNCFATLVEPFPDRMVELTRLYESLETRQSHNLSLSQINTNNSRLKFEQVAICNSPEDGAITMYRNDKHCSLLPLQNCTENVVKAITLQDLMNSFISSKDSRVDVVCINTDGYEWEILKQWNFERHMPYLFEISLDKSTNQIMEKIENLLRSRDYNIFYRSKLYAWLQIPDPQQDSIEYEDGKETWQFIVDRRNEFSQISPDEMFKLRKDMKWSLNYLPLCFGPSRKYLILSHYSLQVPGHHTVVVHKHVQIYDAVFLASQIIKTLKSEINCLAWIGEKEIDLNYLPELLHLAPDVVQEKFGIVTGSVLEWQKLNMDRYGLNMKDGKNWTSLSKDFDKLNNQNRAKICDQLLEEIRLGRLVLNNNELIQLLYESYLGFWWYKNEKNEYPLRERSLQAAKIIHTLHMTYGLEVADVYWSNLVYAGITNPSQEQDEEIEDEETENKETEDEEIKDKEIEGEEIENEDYKLECENYYDYHSILTLM